MGGVRLQSGIPSRPIEPGRRANGLLLRGLVTATYVTDSAGHPQAEAPEDAAPVAVYCDVLVMPSVGGQRWFGLKNVLVTQEIAGLHRGRIWKPRPVNLDFVDTLDIQSGTNPAYTDGDHVLVGFMNDNFSQPIILRALPHPTGDLGREDYDIGTRMKILEADGDPDFFRHHGVHYGVSDAGNFIVDTTFGNIGELEDDGKEKPPCTDGSSGNQEFNLPLDSVLTIHLMDMADPKNPVPKVTIEVSKEGGFVDIKNPAGTWHLKVEDGETVTIEGKDAAAKLTLGDGAVSVAVADHLQTLYEGLKGKLDAFDTHKHPTGVGPSGPPDVLVVADPWDTNINSNKAKIPDTG